MVVRYRDLHHPTKRALHGRNRIGGRHILEEMSHLNSIWLWYTGKRAPEKALDTPTETQAEVLKAFGWEICVGRVLQRRDV